MLTNDSTRQANKMIDFFFHNSGLAKIVSGLKCIINQILKYSLYKQICIVIFLLI